MHRKVIDAKTLQYQYLDLKNIKNFLELLF